LRRDQFVLPDGTVVQPLRSPGGYRYFSIEMLRDIAACCYRHHWFSFDEVKSVFRELAMTTYGDTGDGKIPT
jgi:DNA-binding transcriptional MerR regulator